jgi:hypothetical protein
MKKYILLFILLNTLLFATNTIKKDKRLCKIFQNKIIDYKKNMRDDAYAHSTLESYKKRAKIYCGK